MTYNINCVKNQARKTKKQHLVTHMRALDLAAQGIGFKDYNDFLQNNK